MMNGIFEKLYDMTAFSNIVAEPQFLVMYVIAFVLLTKFRSRLYFVGRQEGYLVHAA